MESRLGMIGKSLAPSSRRKTFRQVRDKAISINVKHVRFLFTVHTDYRFCNRELFNRNMPTISRPNHVVHRNHSVNSDGVKLLLDSRGIFSQPGKNEGVPEALHGCFIPGKAKGKIVVTRQVDLTPRTLRGPHRHLAIRSDHQAVVSNKPNNQRHPSTSLAMLLWADSG